MISAARYTGRTRIVIDLDKARSDQQGRAQVRLWKGALESGGRGRERVR